MLIMLYLEINMEECKKEGKSMKLSIWKNVKKRENVYRVRKAVMERLKSIMRIHCCAGAN